MTKLRINLDDLTQALTTDLALTDGAWYLDLQTGAILLDADGGEPLPAGVEDDPRYLSIECISSHDAFEIMRAFVDTLTDANAVSRLDGALSGRKPFRRFKDALFEHTNLSEDWFAFEEAAHKRIAGEWCAENNFDPEWT